MHEQIVFFLLSDILDTVSCMPVKKIRLIIKVQIELFAYFYNLRVSKFSRTFWISLEKNSVIEYFIYLILIQVTCSYRPNCVR